MAVTFELLLAKIRAATSNQHAFTGPSNLCEDSDLPERYPVMC